MPALMASNLCVFFGKLFGDRAAFGDSLVAIAAKQSRFRGGLVAAATRRQKNDRGEQFVILKRRQHLARRHLRHSQFQRCVSSRGGKW
jgi:hypothetical protein